MLARVKQDPNLDKETAITLPRMSFFNNGMAFEGKRHLNPIGRNVIKHPTNPNKFKTQYNPVPYTLSFSLYIYVKNAEDGTKILEQILPFFTPEWNATVNLIPEMEIVRDITTTLKTVTCEDNAFEGDITSRRAIVWTLEFEMKCWLFGPVVSKPIIKFANTHYFIGNPEDNNAPVKVMTVTPGVLANGDPTTNASLSINPLLIEVTDDWEYCISESSGVTITFE